MPEIVAVHQPNYIPWLGYFYKIFQSETFIFLDDVQFNKEGLQNYHYIKTPQGRFRLKIPVSANSGSLIKDVAVKDQLGWRKKHLKTIEMNYKKAPYFREVFHDYSKWLSLPLTNLAELDQYIIQFICQKFSFKTSFIPSSDFKLQSSGEEKILDICRQVNAKVYYSGTGAKAYQSEESFQQKGIDLKYSIFRPFEYPQLWEGFEPNVSVIDYLMNCGYDWDRVLASQNSGQK